MRFDDRLQTLLDRPAVDQPAKAALWAQIADAMAQAGEAVSPALGEQALARLLEWRHDVSPKARRMVSASLASPRAPAPIVALFASDTAEIAAPMLERANLPDDAWLALIPRLATASRNLLRARPELPFAAKQSLKSFVAADQALPPGRSEPVTQPIQIRDLVARIEAYRKTSLPNDAPGEASRPASFRFETGVDGVLHWVENAPRAALIGLSIASVAGYGESGADQALAAAFAKRLACEKGMLTVHAGQAAGRWEVRAAPVMNASGAFAGYRGVAVWRDEGASSNLLAGALSADSMRQLAHELRTPLNAIRGFADLIAGQYFGPAPAKYRTLAAQIAGDARLLAQIVDDLDSAARIDMGALDPERDGACDAGMVVRRIINDQRAAVEARNVSLRVTAPIGLPEIGLRIEDADALVRRLLAVAIGTAGEGEAIDVALAAGRHVSLTVARPIALAGMSAEDLRQSTLVPDDRASQGPALGLGFSLRLIEALAAAHAARLDIEDRYFLLELPSPARSEAQAA